MRNLTQHTGILEIIKRLKSSVNGNPRYECKVDGWTFWTTPDSAYAYSIEAMEGKTVTVEIGTHYGKAQLHDMWPRTWPRAC